MSELAATLTLKLRCKQLTSSTTQHAELGQGAWWLLSCDENLGLLGFRAFKENALCGPVTMARWWIFDLRCTWESWICKPAATAMPCGAEEVAQQATQADYRHRTGTSFSSHAIWLPVPPPL